jgi:uncharacterized protein YjiS (DUF1127 family)
MTEQTNHSCSYAYDAYEPEPFRGLYLGAAQLARTLADTVVSVIVSIRSGIGESIRQSQDRRQMAKTAGELSRLDDRVLRDIGVRRTEVDFSARRAAED